MCPLAGCRARCNRVNRRRRWRSCSGTWTGTRDRPGLITLGAHDTGVRNGRRPTPPHDGRRRGHLWHRPSPECQCHALRIRVRERALVDLARDAGAPIDRDQGGPPRSVWVPSSCSVFVRASIESHEDRTVVLLDTVLVPKSGASDDDATAVVVGRPEPTLSSTGANVPSALRARPIPGCPGRCH